MSDLGYAALMADRPPEFTDSERRTLLRLVDDKWSDINRERPHDGSFLDQFDLRYLQMLETIQQKLKQ